MGCCRACARGLALTVLAVLVAVVILAAVPAARQGLFVAVHSYSEPGGGAFGAGNLVVLVSTFLGCKLDYIGCVKPATTEDLVAAYGWKHGTGVTFAPSLPGKSATIGFSHAAYKRVAHDPQAARSPDMFILSNMSTLPDGVIPAGVAPSFLNLNTDNTEHFKRRSVMADVFTSLGQHPGPFEIIAPPGLLFVRGSPYGQPWYSDPRAISDILGLNLFRLLFEVELTAQELNDLYEYDGLLAPAVLGMGVSAENGARIAELRAPIEKKVMGSAIGKRYLQKAEAELLGNGESRLKEIIFIAMFAGYGGTGTLCRFTVHHILQDVTANVKLYQQDSAAFVLEAARLYPPVAGMNPFVHTGDEELTFATGRTLSRVAGDFGLIHSTGANLDPQVFGERASDFLPGRANADRLLTWNNELRDIRSCPSAAGCPAAPRGCPGTHLSIHLTERVVGYVVKSIEEDQDNGKLKAEL